MDFRKAATEDNAAKMPWYKKAIKTLGDIFVPILPAIVAGGLLMGILEGLCKLFPQLADSTTYTVFYIFSNAAFAFLQILIAVSAARAFGGNIFLGAVIGMIMIHGDLVNAWDAAAAEYIPTFRVFGLYEVPLIGYQGHVIAVIFAIWLMSALEKWLHKHVPEIIDLFVTPLTTVAVTGYLTLAVIGPVFNTVENRVLEGAQWLVTSTGGIGAFIVGGVYALTVITGVHHMYTSIEVGMLSATGFNYWMPIASAANLAQAGACLAVAVKTKDKKIRSLALPSGLSAVLGITEPALFGINLPFVTPLISGLVGGAVGALTGSLLGVRASSYGITSLFGVLIATECLVSYIITLAVSFAVGFVISLLIYKDKTGFTAENGAGSVSDAGQLVVRCPVEGEVIPSSEINHATFSSDSLGLGVGIKPAKGRVVAPFNGRVKTLYETKNGITLESDEGVSLLIHVGVNTAALNGTHFAAHVREGERVKAGQLLLTMELAKIAADGYDATTAVIVTNPEDIKGFSGIETRCGKAAELAEIIRIELNGVQ